MVWAKYQIWIPIFGQSAWQLPSPTISYDEVNVSPDKGEKKQLEKVALGLSL